MTWWLLVLSFLLGALLSWIYMVRRATREVRIIDREAMAGAATGAGVAVEEDAEVGEIEATKPSAAPAAAAAAATGAGAAAVASTVPREAPEATVPRQVPEPTVPRA